MVSLSLSHFTSNYNLMEPVKTSLSKRHDGRKSRLVAEVVSVLGDQASKSLEVLCQIQNALLGNPNFIRLLVEFSSDASKAHWSLELISADSFDSLESVLEDGEEVYLEQDDQRLILRIVAQVNRSLGSNIFIKFSDDVLSTNNEEGGSNEN